MSTSDVTSEPITGSASGQEIEMAFEGRGPACGRCRPLPAKCSITFGTGITTAEPGSAHGPMLVVVRTAHRQSRIDLDCP